MPTFQNLLVAIEPTADVAALDAASQQAATVAARLAHAYAARLTLLAVTEPAGWFSGAAGEAVEPARQTLATLASELGAVQNRDPQHIDTLLIEQATAWEAIVNDVRSSGRDLVVAGVGSRGGVGRLLFGRTSLRLLRYCPCPVLLVKPTFTALAPQLLVADDLGDTGLAAIRLAADLAAKTGGSVQVVHAVDLSLERRILMVSHEGRYETERSARIAEAKRLLAERIALVQAERTSATSGHSESAAPVPLTSYICEGEPEIVLLETIAQAHPDLLVMGMRGRVGMAGMMLGNTAEKLLPQVSCSLLAIKPTV